MLKLSKRLQAVADFVTVGNRVADIGTDHGFLPIYLVQSGKCPQAIAMDVRKGPLERAREHIAAAALEPYIQTRLSDGMHGLAKGEADSVVIAGMGGLTAIQILEAGLPRLTDWKELILEPQSEAAKVRQFLHVHKMYIDKEDLVLEAGKFYPILHVIPNKLQTEEAWISNGQDKPQAEEAWSQNRHGMQAMLWEKLADEGRICGLLDQYGECMVYGKHPVLRLMLQRDEERELGILRELAKGVRATHGQQGVEAMQARRDEVERRLEEIRVLLEVMDEVPKAQK